jgi:hypothetical protein
VKRNKGKQLPDPVPNWLHPEKDDTVTSTPIDYETLHDFVVTTTDGKTHNVTANRMYTNQTVRSATFHGQPGQPHSEVATFFSVLHAEQVPGPSSVWPSPVKGVEYYSLEDVRQALKDLNYHGADSIVDKVSQRLSVRDDGRYTLTELQDAAKQIGSSSGSYYADKFVEAALQARKNRVFKAHNGS